MKAGGSGVSNAGAVVAKLADRPTQLFKLLASRVNYSPIFNTYRSSMSMISASNKGANKALMNKTNLSALEKAGLVRLSSRSFSERFSETYVDMTELGLKAAEQAFGYQYER